MKPTPLTTHSRNLKNEVIGLDYYPTPDYSLKTPEALAKIRLFEKEYENNRKRTYTAPVVTEQEKQEKHSKPVSGILNRHIDTRKIQSNTKDIEEDTGNNFVSDRKVVIVPTEPSAPRSTLSNVFSNSGGNGLRPDFTDFQSEKANKRRHRRGRQNR